MKENKIIVEGFWGIGKTKLCRSLSEKMGLIQIEEPDHLILKVTENVDDFYISEHKENIKNLSGKKGLIMERSLISSLAFLYAKNIESIESLLSEHISNINLIIKEEVLILFLYCDKKTILENIKQIKDHLVKDLFENTDFASRYEHFYRVILPFKFGICPVCIKVDDDAGNLISIDQAVNTVQKIIREDRVAQVNVVPFIREGQNIKYLTLQRNERKGGFWQTITGGIHIVGSLHDNVLREIKEELNLLNTETKKLFETDYSFHYIGGEGYELNEYVFGYELENERIVLSDEHVDFAFLSIEEATERVKWEGNKEAIRQVDKFLNSNK